MTVLVNDQPTEIEAGTTISGLLAELGLAEARVAVVVGREIVAPGLWSSRVLRQSDVIEIVSFVGGGI